MMRRLALHAAMSAVIAWMLLSVGCASLPDAAVSEIGDGVSSESASCFALQEAMSLLDVEKNDERVLLLTNAGYARPDGRGTEPFADAATAVSGCSIGKRSLYFIHTPSTAPFWFALFHRDTRQIVFGKWVDDAYESQVIEAPPDLLDRPDAWKAANAGPVRGSLFQILSVANAWAQGADPLLLKCAEFHNHCCGGVTAGYLAGRYIQTNLPLRAGERYVFVSASPACAMDALQVMFDTTAGKQGMFTGATDADTLSKYTVGDARPLTLVMRVNEGDDTCDGLFLGFAWLRTGQKSKLWNAAEVEKLDCVKVLKRFSGPASLARELSASGSDPYALVWDE
jgi:formylmethanofuran dehydrogenase subunit E-like metal-binding protein